MTQIIKCFWKYTQIKFIIHKEQHRLQTFIQICHKIEKPANMQIISLKMHEVKNYQTEMDSVCNLLSDSTRESLKVRNIEFLYREIITWLLRKCDFRGKWPLTFDLRSRSFNPKRKIGDTTFLVAWTQLNVFVMVSKKLTCDVNENTLAPTL